MPEISSTPPLSPPRLNAGLTSGRAGRLRQEDSGGPEVLGTPGGDS